MATSEKFCLRWNDFESNISMAFREIREEKDFFDCTLSVGDRQLQAHKLILSACSPFFRSVLKKNPHQHPLLYLKGVEFSDLQSVLNFMYHGEVNVAQEDLNSFLAVAEDLKIKGLTQNNSSDEQSSGLKSTNRPSEAIAPLRSSSTPKAVPIDPPAPKRPRPPPLQYPTTPQDDDDIQEVMPVVKTEHIVIEPQPSVTTFQQSEVEQPNPYSGNGGQVVDGALTHMEDQTGYGDDDGYDYGGYEDNSFDGMEGATMGDTSKGQGEMYFTDMDLMDLYIDQHINLAGRGSGGWMCGICEKFSINRLDIKRHFESKHCSTPGFSCDNPGCQGIVHNYKTRHSLATHKRLKHNITETNLKKMMMRMMPR